MKKPFWEVISTLDKRWIFLSVFIVITLPILFPINLPLKASEPVKKFYENIESLPEGSLVMISDDYDPGSKAELYPMTESVMYHIFKKKLRVVIVSLYASSPPMTERALNVMRTLFPNIKEGVDYVNLGYKDGREATIVEMGRALQKAFPTDFRGNPVGNIPIMKGVENYNSFKALISISVGYPGTKEYVQYAQGRFNINLLTGAAAVSVPEYSAYYNAGQIKGMLTGITGAGEYEDLIGRRALAAKATDALSFGHVFIIFLILIGNVAWFTQRHKGASHE